MKKRLFRYLLVVLALGVVAATAVLFVSMRPLAV